MAEKNSVDKVGNSDIEIKFGENNIMANHGALGAVVVEDSV